MKTEVSTVRLKNVSTCVECGADNDSATGLSGRPSDGDLSICAYCGHMAIYQPNLSLREPTSEEKESKLSLWRTAIPDPDRVER